LYLYSRELGIDVGLGDMEILILDLYECGEKSQEYKVIEI